MNKPDGLTVVRPKEALDFVAGLPIEKFYGVGPATAKRFRAIGIKNGADLRRRTREELVRHFGRSGHRYYRIARGVDDSPVEPRRERKLVSAERTFAEDLTSLERMVGRIHEIADEVARRLEESYLEGRTITIKIKYHDFEVCTRSKTMSSNVSEANEIPAIAGELLRETDPTRPVRLLGVGVSKLGKRESVGSQLKLDFQ